MKTYLRSSQLYLRFSQNVFAAQLLRTTKVKVKADLRMFSPAERFERVCSSAGTMPALPACWGRVGHVCSSAFNVGRAGEDLR